MRTILLPVLLSLLAAGCATITPWERETLADRTMIFATEMEESILDHTFYTAREGSAGGFESGGGGCGCN